MSRRLVGNLEIMRILEMVMPFDRQGFFPETTDEAIEMLRRINKILDQVEEQQIPQRVASTVDNVNDTVTETKKLVRIAQWKVTQVDVRAINDNTDQHSHVYFRFFNEVPVLFLFGIVILAVLKPF